MATVASEVRLELLQWPSAPECCSVKCVLLVEQTGIRADVLLDSILELLLRSRQVEVEMIAEELAAAKAPDT